MKLHIIAAAAVLALTSPLAALPAAADPPPWAPAHGYREHQGERHHWQRGERYDYQNSHYAHVDWRRERLREPPRGYRYVRDHDTGQTLLIGIATGVILGIILANN